MYTQDPPSHSRTGNFSPDIDAGLKSHFEKVYGLMACAMLITGLTAWSIAGLSVNEGEFTAFGTLLFASPLKWVIVFAPLLAVIWLSVKASGLSASATRTAFYGLSVLMGLCLSSIFLIFTGTSIAQTFMVTASAFAGLSLYGYTTKRDLSPMGSFLIMGVVGLIAMMVINIFIGSTVLDLALSFIGLMIFAGLTAHDTQKIKTDYISHAAMRDAGWMDKAATFAALSLYLDFVNMFQFLLSFLGDRG